jgi:hypothetical protein
MRFRVVPMRDRGRARPQQLLRAESGLLGDLVVIEARDELLKRTVRIAHLRPGSYSNAGELLPPIIDPMLWMAPHGFAIGGFERLVSGSGGAPADYAQTWWVREAAL